MPLTQGQTIYNRYRIAKLIGQGGFGAVYRAWDLNLNHPCALKENLDTGVEAQRQFEREAMLLANLQHPNLPRVTDHFVLPGQGQYLVMDFVEGHSLEQILAQQSRPLTEAEALPWFEQVCQAVDYLHHRTQPIIHRDIKPQNVIITQEGRAMLVDFGISKLYDPQVKTTAGARAFSPGFSPIEQYGQGRTDARSDIYALGATLYTLLTGQTPPESVDRLTGVPLVPPRQLNPFLSPTVEQAILQAMALQSGDRFQNVQGFQAALRYQTPAVSLSPSPQPMASPTPVSPLTPQPIISPPAPTLPPSSPFWRQYGGLVAIGLILLVALIGGVILILSSRSTSPQVVVVKVTAGSTGASVSGISIETPPPTQPKSEPPTLAPVAAARTSTPTPPPAATWTPTSTPPPAATWTSTPTPLPPTFTPVPQYTGPRPPGRFGDIWDSLGGATGALGIPGELISERNYSHQYFAGGFMFWWDNPADPNYVWAVYGNGDNGNGWNRYIDTWTSAESIYTCSDAHEPNGPAHGFGKVWCENTEVRTGLGTALQPEFGSGDVYPKAILQYFSNGVIFYVPADEKIWALSNDGRWQWFNK